MKELQNTYIIQVEFDDTNSEMITDVSLHYGVKCQCGQTTRKGMPIELSTRKIAELEELLFEEALPQANLEEGIEEED